MPHVINLGFGRLTDYWRLMNALYSPEISAAIDPERYVIDRPKGVREAALRAGDAAIVSDAKQPEIILAATFTYHAASRYREIGSTRSRLPGAGRISVALATLNHALRYPGQTLVAAIQLKNERSLSAYEYFTLITDKRRSAKLHEFTGKEPAPAGEKSWFECTPETLCAHAAIILDTRRHGLATTGGRRIPVDATALDRAGLTETYLEKIVSPQQVQLPERAPALLFGN